MSLILVCRIHLKAEKNRSVRKINGLSFFFFFFLSFFHLTSFLNARGRVEVSARFVSAVRCLSVLLETNESNEVESGF